MRKLQTQGVHHITIVGADRQTSIDFWEGVLGMPFVFEQPNLDNAAESHLYFDPGDGRLITIFTDDERVPDPERTPTYPGCVQMTGNVFVIQLASGRHVKLVVDSFYSPEVQQECQDTGAVPMGDTGSGNFVVRWAWLD